MEQVGIDPETGEFDADVVETGQSKSQRDRRNQLVAVIEEKGATTADELTNVLDMDRDKVDADIQALKGQGMIYEMQQELRKA
jgi:replicative DNA helicase Mcm